MKQLLIVKSPSTFSSAASPIDNGLTSHGVKDISGLKNGAITFFELGSDTAKYNSALAKNFGIALGRPNGQAPFVIPEVDFASLKVTKALPLAGTKFQATFTITAPVNGEQEEYVLQLFKKAVVSHERNAYSFNIIAKGTDAGNIAVALVNDINMKANNMNLNIKAYNGTTTLKGTVSSLPSTTTAANDIYLLTADDASSHKAGHYYKASATSSITWTDVTANVIITGTDYQDWECQGAEGLMGLSITTTNAKKPVGDKAYIQNLASQCAAGKGFVYTEGEGKDVLPGYPEEVENLTPNTSGGSGASTSGYVIYTLRFAVHRDSAKTRDEVVSQLVHIAVPIDDNGTYSQITSMDTILGVS